MMYVGMTIYAYLHNILEVSMKVAICARVSTDEKGQGPETPLIRLRALATARGQNVVHHRRTAGSVAIEAHMGKGLLKK